MKRRALKTRLMMGSLLGLSMLAAAAPGFAENRPGAITVSPYVGGYTYDGDQDLEISPIFGVRAGYNFNEHWGAEAAFGYVNGESKIYSFRETNFYSYGIDGLFHFNVTPNLVPFVAAGVGGATFNWPGSAVPNDTDWTVNYGVGIKYFVADNVALRGDVRHVFVPDGSKNNLVYTAGVTFQIGGVKPAAKASAEMPAAASAAAAIDCPIPAPDTAAPTVSLTAPVKGATDANVRRNVYVAFSEPMDPATMNGANFYLMQGNEQVAGRVSSPTATSASISPASELKPGTVYTARVATGARDLAGNQLANDHAWTFTTASLPTTAVQTKVVIVNKFVMLEDTHFEFDKATLTAPGKLMLDQNIKIMKDNPELKVRIAGFTSAAGTAKYNQGLSERRAGAVQTYLIEAGAIEPNRLDTIGYGATRPAVIEPMPSDVESAAAKANMRVLFEVVVK